VVDAIVEDRSSPVATTWAPSASTQVACGNFGAGENPPAPASKRARSDAASRASSRRPR